MAIKRFIATKDTTITNAYKQSLSSRATASNMGASDILEVFTVYAQVSTSSTEESRALVNFNFTDVGSKRTDGDIPASGSVNFFLRMFNAEHSETVPISYTMQITAITKSWQEGYGLDMEEYSDVGYPDGVGATWISASDDSTSLSRGKWITAGGDFYTGVSNEYNYTASFDEDGTEDLEVDVTNLVEDFLDPRAQLSGSHGLGVRIAPVSASLAKSHYTKRFFARGSEFFFKRPMLEARWDSSKKDSSNNFYLSSSMMPAADNLNKLYLYNYVRGALQDIPNIGSGKRFLVSLVSGSADNVLPTGSFLSLPPGGSVRRDNETWATASRIEKGIYSASLAYNSSSITTVFPIWHSASNPAGASRVQYYTGSAITIQTYSPTAYNASPQHVSKITNLKSVYSTNETAVFRLYVREKDWNPTIYSKASTDIENKTIEDAYFKVIRIADDHQIIGYGTGSVNHTLLSYDASGSYFDLDMSMFEQDYAYGIKLLYKVSNKFVEQPEVFKFRVE